MHVVIAVSPTNELSRAFLDQLRTFLDDAFAGELTDQDWQHALGGVHVWAADADGVVSHAALVERTLLCDGKTLRVGFVEAVATRADRRRQGHGTAVMVRIGALIGDRYALGALSSGEYTFYERLGWERWRGPTFADGPSGRIRTPDDDGGVLILRTRRAPHLDLDGDIVCDWRPGDVW